MRIRPVLHLATALLAFTVTQACFEESGGSGSGGTDGCAAGSPGCDCYGNGTCDGTAECMDGKCIEPNCTPGEENCTCNDGLCLGTLECQEGVCKQGGGGTSTTGPDTTDTTTDGTDSSSDTTPTDSAGTSVGPTGPDTTATGGGACPIDNTEPDCEICLKDNCCDSWQNCQNDDTCTCIVECINGGTDPMQCGPQCGPPSDAFNEINSCIMGTCMPSCVPGGGGLTCDDIPMDGPQCSWCMAGQCCAELEACLAVPECDCTELCAAQLQPGDPLDQCFQDCNYDPNNTDWQNLIDCAAAQQCFNEFNTPCYEG